MILWSPIIIFLSMLIISLFGAIWSCKFTEFICKIWVTLGLVSFFSLIALSTIDKAEKSNSKRHNP